MQFLVILSLVLSSVFGEAPAPYPPSGWRPQGEPFTLPSRQQLSQQYGAPQNNQQFNTNQYSNFDLNRQYGTPLDRSQNGAASSVDSLNTQYLPSAQSPRNFNNPVNTQYIPQNRNQQQFMNNFDSFNNNNLPNQQQSQNFNNPTTNSQYTPQNLNNNPPNRNQQQFNSNFDSLNSNNVPSQQQPRNFNNPAIQSTSQNLNNNPPNRNQQQFRNTFDSSNTNNQRQSGKLIAQNSPDAFGASNLNFQRQNPLKFNQNPVRNREEINDSDELNQEQLDDQNENLNEEDFTVEPDPEYGAPTTTKRPTKAPRKPERTTPKPRTTTEEPDRDGDFDQPNVAISTAAASTSGQYYILQPDGKLQRVIYMTSPDAKDNKNAAFIANLMYETVEPLRGPIYQYVGSELVRIN